MKYAVEIASCGMIYLLLLLSFMKIGSGIQTLIGRTHRHTLRQQDDLISLLLFFQNEESMLKTCNFPSPSLDRIRRLDKHVQ
jgi:hypothetical protein